MITITEEEEISLSAVILMPRLGLRKNLKSVNRIKTYLQAETYLTIPFISIDGGYDSASEAEIETNIGLIANVHIASALEVQDSCGFSTWKLYSDKPFTNIVRNNIKIPQISGLGITI